MPVRIIEEETLWDKFVESSPYSTLFHRWKFLKIVEKYSGYHLAPYGIYKGEHLSCILPLFTRKKSGLKLAYSPPQQAVAYIPYLGFIPDSEYARMKQHKKEPYLDFISKGIDEAISAEAPNHAFLSLAPGLTDLREFRNMGYSVDLGYTYIIDLSRPVDELWNNMSKTCRQTIRYWDDRRVEVRPSGDIDAFFTIMRRTLEKEGNTFFHNQSPEYLKEILATFPDNVKMYTMYSEDNPVAMQVNVQYRDRLLFWMYGRNGNCGSPVEYLNWELIKMAKETGLRVVENWGTETKRLNAYKAKFDPALEVCCGLHKSDVLGKLATMTYSSITRVPGLASVFHA
ncbi:GNAT family N-acetyltransferase [Methanocella arvoryzae]|uniref:BioF2-like acetyltransferase domain-containing protein n=1 Tax=Methanocella arvoryzae (strain DSM 22066 / NBRC 105507 / MRE50) TaxID=351160 RepID=Q0W2V6_METAR|nr:GNAT family N-acetyltransferase [Methanocella arvoryzae]CAJ37287.1 hypothetical protein RCIX2163 [Methanocella arvoryzae MRE50]